MAENSWMDVWMDIIYWYIYTVHFKSNLNVQNVFTGVVLKTIGAAWLKPIFSLFIHMLLNIFYTSQASIFSRKHE